MDRYLGATSASGDTGDIGLQYQWGRKDPFIRATEKSTVTLWPTSVTSSYETGNYEYAVANPMTLIEQNYGNDWLNSLQKDYTRWQSVKTTHDPCPPGWKMEEEGNPASTINYAWKRSVRCIKETVTNPYSSTSDLDASSASDLSRSGTANCYIVSRNGLYKFKAVKGNSTDSVGDISHCALVWETLGTSSTTKMTELIKEVSFNDEYIIFRTADEFKKGNALIAAYDDRSNILWSWHIWLTEQPGEHIHYNNAGIMMDRNLGAVSTAQGESGTGGLFYQWGRRNPLFPEDDDYMRATIEKPVVTAQQKADWGSSKTVADPCPVGWKVPQTSVWDKAVKKGLPMKVKFDKYNNGRNFGGKFGADMKIWYGTHGHLISTFLHLSSGGGYWTSTPSDGSFAYRLELWQSKVILNKGYMTDGCSVRCCKEE